MSTGTIMSVDCQHGASGVAVMCQPENDYILAALFWDAFNDLKAINEVLVSLRGEVWAETFSDDLDDQCCMGWHKKSQFEAEFKMN